MDNNILFPINKLAAVVTQANGVHWDIDKIPDSGYESELPFPSKSPPKNAKNMIGVKCDRFIVVGYYGTTQLKMNGKRIRHLKSG